MIRPANAADLPALIDLERVCATAAHWTEQQYQRVFCPREGDPYRLVIVADAFSRESSHTSFGASPEIRGFLVARQLAPEWELENVVVAPANRRSGIGKRLIEALLTAARETNSEAVFLEVRDSNTAARSLYEKTGFDLTGSRKSYYTNPPEDAVLYRLCLT